MLFSLFLIIDLYFPIPVVIGQVFHSTAELTIPIGIPTKEAKTENEILPEIADTKINQCLL